MMGSYGAHDVCSQGYLADATCSCDDDAKVEIVANEKDNGDKKNWLSSTHFWNTNDNLETVEEKEEMRAVIIRLLHLYYRIMSSKETILLLIIA
ncbi:hypothetical protein Tco_0726286 [Tanacetum coccineum]|uniref:Uncharacterized protein n=1 Tax=Tanacetum coccineum TaxID=301880 RepID=A0ABQ4YHG4_9ASTR